MSMQQVAYMFGLHEDPSFQ